MRRTQLLRSHLWPATVYSPHSACTFISLCQFHTFNCIAKIPAYDYYKGLETMTENRNREKPKVSLGLCSQSSTYNLYLEGSVSNTATMHGGMETS